LGARAAFPVWFLVVVAATIATHLYFHGRLVRDTARRPRARFAGFAAAAAGTLLVVAAPLASRTPLAPAAAGPLEKVGYLWWGVMLYLLLALAAFEPVRLLGRCRASRGTGSPKSLSDSVDPSRRLLLARTGAALSVVATGAALGRGMPSALGPPALREVPVRLPRLPRALDGLTVVLITDLHAGGWIGRRFVDDLVARTNALRPDLVAITGDLVEGPVDRIAPLLGSLAGLRPRWGTYYCTGNHEYYWNVDAWTQWLRRAGIAVLRNARATAGEPGAELDIVGVDDWMGGHRDGESRWNLPAALAGRAADRPALLLAHQPRGFEQAAAAGVDLQLSGHTHGGQMWPWTHLVAAAYHPYAAGLARLGGSSLYVSRGCGFWGPPLRLGAPSELTKLVLLAG